MDNHVEVCRKFRIWLLLTYPNLDIDYLVDEFEKDYFEFVEYHSRLIKIMENLESSKK